MILFPRLKKYDEHYDDHQLDLCSAFLKKNYVMCAKDENELKECILNLDSFKPEVFISSNQHMNKLIIDFIETGKKPER